MIFLLLIRYDEVWWCVTCPEAMMLISWSTAETLTDVCGCFRLSSSDVSDSPKICRNQSSRRDYRRPIITQRLQTFMHNDLQTCSPEKAPWWLWRQGTMATQCALHETEKHCRVFSMTDMHLWGLYDALRFFCIFRRRRRGRDCHNCGKWGQVWVQWFCYCVFWWATISHSLSRSVYFFSVQIIIHCHAGKSHTMNYCSLIFFLL